MHIEVFVSNKEIIAFPDRPYNLYTTPSDQTFLKTNIIPPQMDEIILHFSIEVNAYLDSMMHVCTFGVNPLESDAIWTNFRRWIISHTLDLQNLSFLDTTKRFQTGISKVTQLILDRYQPLCLPALEPVVVPISEEPASEVEL